MHPIVSQMRKFLNKPVGYGTGITILVGTLLMTLMFWKSQSLDVVKYADLIAELSELKYFDARLDRHLAVAAQYGELDYNAITVDNYALREVINNVNQIRKNHNGVGAYLGEGVLATMQSHISQKLQYLDEAQKYKYFQDSLATAWLQELAAESSLEKRKTMQQQIIILKKISHSDLAALQKLHATSRFAPDELWQRALVLQSRYEELRQMKIQVYADNLIQDSRAQLQKISDFKMLIHQGYYFLSLLFMLIVMVLIVRIPK